MKPNRSSTAPTLPACDARRADVVRLEHDVAEHRVPSRHTASAGRPGCPAAAVAVHAVRRQPHGRPGHPRRLGHRRTWWARVTGSRFLDTERQCCQDNAMPERVSDSRAGPRRAARRDPGRRDAARGGVLRPRGADGRHRAAVTSAGRRCTPSRRQAAAASRRRGPGDRAADVPWPGAGPDPADLGAAVRAGCAFVLRRSRVTATQGHPRRRPTRNCCRWSRRRRRPCAVIAAAFVGHFTRPCHTPTRPAPSWPPYDRPADHHPRAATGAGPELAADAIATPRPT